MKSILIGVALAGVTAAANSWQVDHGDVRVICPMTIGGSFEARTTAISGAVTASAGGTHAFDGSLAVDLRTLDTGIGLRNEHLRGTYLEVTRGPGFETATLSDIDVRGVTPDAPEGRGSFTAALTVHGVTKPVTGAIDVRRSGAGLHVTAAFPVTLADYSIRRPRYLGVGVKDTVTVQVTFAVTR